jgi:hypothetical protein
MAVHGFLCALGVMPIEGLAHNKAQVADETRHPPAAGHRP